MFLIKKKTVQIFLCFGILPADAMHYLIGFFLHYLIGFRISDFVLQFEDQKNRQDEKMHENESKQK